jgi:hypothetical protein
MYNKFDAIGRCFRRPCSLYTALALLTALIIMVPRDGSGAWPFSSSENKAEESYLARVGTKTITLAEFQESVNNLHKSRRVGKALSGSRGGGRAFSYEDFPAYLDELIGNKLMVMEAEATGLDKEIDFTSQMDSFILNIFLGQLRRDEVFGKVKVLESEIEEYWAEQMSKEHVPGAGGGDADAEKQEDTSPDEASDEAGPELEEVMAPAPAMEITPQAREEIRQALFNQKAKERESEFFAELHDRATYKVDEDLVRDFSRQDPKHLESTVAVVNGEAITGMDFLRALRGRVPSAVEVRRNVLMGVIRNKTLDQEALGRGYEKVPDFKKRIDRFREGTLIDLFKQKVVSPLVKLEEKEILEYYNRNTASFMESDTVGLRGILVVERADAAGIADELRSGADFAFLAREHSLDRTAKDGGEMGWLSVGRFPVDILAIFETAELGEILGPFRLNNGFMVFEFLGYKKGASKPLESVRENIISTVGRQKFEAVLKEYLVRLRGAVPVDINQSMLERLKRKR